MRATGLVSAFALGLIAAAVAVPPLARAETFLGEEKATPDTKPSSKSRAASSPPGPSSAAPLPAAPPSADQLIPPEEAAADSGDSASTEPSTRAHKHSSPEAGWDTEGDRFVFAGALGAGADFVSGQATVGYYVNAFAGLEATYYYYQFNSDAAAGQQFGPELDAVFRLANPWILTPFAGLGPGYTQWRSTYHGTQFDKNHSFTINQFVGADLKLTSHFGIEVMRKQQVYLNERPKSFDDRVTQVARSSWMTDIGFRVFF